MIRKAAGPGDFSVDKSAFNLKSRVDNVGKKPREINVGVYIQRALWEVKFVIVFSISTASEAFNDIYIYVEGDRANCGISQGKWNVYVFKKPADLGIQTGKRKTEDAWQWRLQGEVQRENTKTGELWRENQENLQGQAGREQDQEIQAEQHFRPQLHIPRGCAKYARQVTIFDRNKLKSDSLIIS